MTDALAVDDEKFEANIEDGSIFKQFTPELQKWWFNQFEETITQSNSVFTPPQKEAIPHIKNGDNTLIASPTGSGKTLASFSTIIDDLLRRQDNGTLQNSVYCLYISPLKSLANDIHRNLSRPLTEIQESKGVNESQLPKIRHAIRHSDTKQSEKQKMLRETPHILNTTPETLAILLNSKKFKKKLETVEYVIVDEIHSLADNKRGAHLAVSLERLENMINKNPVRIGCSATVDPLKQVGEFLVGKNETGEKRDFKTVDCRFTREFDLEVETPVPNLLEVSNEEITEKFYNRVHNLIQGSKNTLVFTNTRSGAERVLKNLRDTYGQTYTEENSGCHHGSLSKERRKTVETKLKNGDLDVVTSSTSLELGIDMPYVDLVIQVGSPKSISALLQRIGRAGHTLGETVKGRIICLEREDLVECTVMAKKALEGDIDTITIPTVPQDVAAQHIYGMAINSVRPKREVYNTLKRAYPFMGYSQEKFENLLSYLTLEYDQFEDSNVYPKIWCDSNDSKEGEYHYPEYDVGEKLIGKRGKLARMIYMTNIGTIPESFVCNVVTRSDDSLIGSLDEDYLNTLDKGDVFTLGGNRYEYRYRRGSKVYVDETSQRPTVPTWFSEQLPLSFDLGEYILDFQEQMYFNLTNPEASVIQFLREYPLNQNAMEAIHRLYKSQVAFLETPNIQRRNNFIIEKETDEDQFVTRYYIHSFYGRKFNEGLSRLIAQEIAKEKNINVKLSVSDQGFTVSIPLSQSVNIKSCIKNIDVSSLHSELRSAVKGTDLYKRYFRINAIRFLLILKNYKGNKKSAKSQQVASEKLLNVSESIEEFPVINETHREILEDKLNITQIENVLQKIQKEEKSLTVHEISTPSPQMFSLATLATSDVVLANDESVALEKFHKKVVSNIDSDIKLSESSESE